MATPLLELESLSVHLAGRPVLHALTGSLSGRVVGLLGPNGAGKTTLLNTLLGFYRPSSGSAKLLGRDAATDLHAIRERLGYMPESDAFVSGMSAVRFVRMMGELSGLPRKGALERAHEALFWVGLGEARYRKLETYSLGMKQLAKLAQAIVHGPEVVFLDEPTNGLDPSARDRMLRLIREVAEAGVRVILSSHLLRDVEACADEVIVLKEGRIAAIADLSREHPANRRFLELEARGGEDGAFVEGLTGLGCEVAELANRRLKVILADGLEVRALYRLAEERGIQLRRLTSSRDSLEHLFLKAMEENGATRAGL
jgi:ABC-2 type transport system ATP-binding protein